MKKVFLIACLLLSVAGFAQRSAKKNAKADTSKTITPPTAGAGKDTLAGRHFALIGTQELWQYLGELLMGNPLRYRGQQLSASDVFNLVNWINNRELLPPLPPGAGGTSPVPKQ